MSLYDTIFAAKARPALFAAFGRSITYTVAATQTASTITAAPAAIADELIDVQEAGGPRVRCRQRILEVSLANVATPRRPDVATIDGEDWTVHELLVIEAGIARLLLVRPIRVEAGGRRTRT